MVEITFITNTDNSASTTEKCKNKYETFLEDILKKINELNGNTHSDLHNEWVTLNQYINERNNELKKCVDDNYIPIDLYEQAAIKKFRNEYFKKHSCTINTEHNAARNTEPSPQTGEPGKECETKIELSEGKVKLHTASDSKHSKHRITEEQDRVVKNTGQFNTQQSGQQYVDLQDPQKVNHPSRFTGTELKESVPAAGHKSIDHEEAGASSESLSISVDSPNEELGLHQSVTSAQTKHTEKINSGKTSDESNIHEVSPQSNLSYSQYSTQQPHGIQYTDDESIDNESDDCLYLLEETFFSADPTNEISSQKGFQQVGAHSIGAHSRDTDGLPYTSSNTGTTRDNTAHSRETSYNDNQTITVTSDNIDSHDGSIGSHRSHTDPDDLANGVDGAHIQRTNEVVTHGNDSTDYVTHVGTTSHNVFSNSEHADGEIFPESVTRSEMSTYEPHNEGTSEQEKRNNLVVPPNTDPVVNNGFTPIINSYNSSGIYTSGKKIVLKGINNSEDTDTRENGVTLDESNGDKKGISYQKYIKMILVPLTIILLFVLLVKYTPLGMLFTKKQRKKKKKMEEKLKRVLLEPSFTKEERIQMAYSSC